MENVINALSLLGESIEKSIKEFDQSRDLASKRQYAEIIKMLCESMGVFITAAHNHGDDDFDEFDFDEDDSDDYDEHEFKNKKGKKGHKDLPF